PCPKRGGSASSRSRRAPPAPTAARRPGSDKRATTTVSSRVSLPGRGYLLKRQPDIPAAKSADLHVQGGEVLVAGRPRRGTDRFQAEQVAARLVDRKAQRAFILVLGAEVHAEGALGDHALLQVRHGPLTGPFFLDREEVDRDVLERGFRVGAAQLPLDRDPLAGLDLQNVPLLQFGARGSRLRLSRFPYLARADLQVDGKGLRGRGGREQAAEGNQNKEEARHGGILSGQGWEGTTDWEAPSSPIVKRSAGSCKRKKQTANR